MAIVSIRRASKRSRIRDCGMYIPHKNEQPRGHQGTNEHQSSQYFKLISHWIESIGREIVTLLGSYMPRTKTREIPNKQKELIQYIVERYPGTHRYPVLKLMYIVEDAYLDEFGVKLSEDRYHEMPYGPVPQNFKTIMDDMGKNNILVQESDISEDGDCRILLPGDSPDVKPKFTSIEKKLINHVLDFLHTKTGFDSDSLHAVCERSERWQKAQRTRPFRRGNTYLLPKGRIQKPTNIQLARRLWKEHLENSNEIPTETTHSIETATQ